MVNLLFRISSFHLFKILQLGKVIVATIRIINDEKITVQWIEHEELLAKDVNKNQIELFENYSFRKYFLRSADKITLRLVLIILLLILSINGIYNSYFIILSNFYNRKSK